MDASGNWTNWNDPWNSALKMHAAGFLSYIDGLLNNRGTIGYYWSCMQGGATISWDLGFVSDVSGVFSDAKVFGLSARCVRD